MARKLSEYNTSSKIASWGKCEPGEGKTDILRQKWIERVLIDPFLS